MRRPRRTSGSCPPSSDTRTARRDFRLARRNPADAPSRRRRRRADEPDCEARLVGHRNERRLAVARRGLRWPRVVSVDVAIRSPGSRARALAPTPTRGVRPSRRACALGLVGEADDSVRESSAVVGLDAGGREQRKSPAFLQYLLAPVLRSGPGVAGMPGRGLNHSSITDGHWAEFCAGVVSAQLDVDGDLRIGAVVDVADESAW